MASKQFINHLKNETSPYLLQHVHNPVDWYPWKKEAFEKAEKNHLPIFLSIGYSTCHWCHVMEHESFENPEVADFLNKNFVSIKVDREERPDIDQLYMQYLLTQTGSGGWPMSIWLTDKKVPFYAATYIPMWPANEKRKGFQGNNFLEVLKRIAELWQKPDFRQEMEMDNTFNFLQKLLCQEYFEEDEKPQFLGKTTSTQFEFSTVNTNFNKMADNLINSKKYYDELNGGFSGKNGPKFPNFSLFRILLDACSWADEKPTFNNFLTPIVNSLRKICFGGIYDHLGGGFHRYSVDRWWHVPHFEKMLYNQAQNVDALMESCALLKDQRFDEKAFQKNNLNPTTTFHFFVQKVNETLDYVSRDLIIKPEPGKLGFFSGEDADSKYIAPEIQEEKKVELKRTGNKIEHEHMEGGFYVWTKQELELVLTESGKFSKTEIDDFSKMFSIQTNSNIRYESDPRGELRQHKFNVLAINEIEWNILEKSGNAEEAHKKIEKLEEIKNTLFEYRKNRPRPGTDTKTISSWNAMMNSTFSRAAIFEKCLGNAEKSDKYLRIAEENCEFLMKYLRIPDEIMNNDENLKKLGIKNAFVHSRSLPNEEKVKGKIGIDPKDEIILFCEDYAEILKMLLNLYEATAKFDYLKKSVEIASDVFKLFWDDTKGGFFENKISETSPILSKKTEDSTLLSSNAVVFESLLRLSHLMHWNDEKTEKTKEGESFQKSFIDKQHSFMSCQLDKISEMVVGSLSVFNNDFKVKSENFKNFAEFLVVFDSKNQEHLEKLSKFQIEVLGKEKKDLETWLFPFKRSIFYFDVSKANEILETISGKDFSKFQDWKSEEFLKNLETVKQKKEFFVQKCENQKCEIVSV